MTLAKISVLGAGQGWIGIDKPAGLSVHNDPNGDALALVGQLLRENDALRSQCAADADLKPAPVHRLDKETSGVLLLSTRRDYARALQEAFAKKEHCKKIYRACLRGVLRSETGSWLDPLSDQAEGRRSPQGPVALRKACETRFQVLRSTQHLSDVELEILTGRQHQIRRHAVLNGHQVINDGRYGDARYQKLIERIYGVERMMLHAWRLKVSLSLNAEAEIDLEAPVPEEFTKLFLNKNTSISSESD